MKDKPKAARRIEAEARMKGRALRRLRPTLESPLQPLHPMDAEVAAGKLARTPTPCSCPMCGNPRKHAKGQWRRTLAEQKAFEREETNRDREET